MMIFNKKIKVLKEMHSSKSSFKFNDNFICMYYNFYETYYFIH